MLNKDTFVKDTPVIWVTYLPGSAGDFLSFLISRHYNRTGTEFSFNCKTGKCEFVSTDSKTINDLSNLIIDDNFYFMVDTVIGDKTLYVSQLDTLIFSNHWLENKNIQHILESLTNVKIIRILPKTIEENKFICLASSIKVTASAAELGINDFEKWQHKVYSTNKTYEHITEINDPRVLELTPSDFLVEKNFETCYNKLTKFLNIELNLISKDIVKSYYNMQTPQLKQALDLLNGH
jgi:hypothetical protein